MRCHELSHHRDTPCNEPCPLQQTIATRQPTNVRHVHLSASGKERTIELRATPIFDDQGEVVEVVEVGQDITEQIALQRQKQSLRAQFAQAQKMETVGTLAGGVAHDFNNLLTVIMSFTEMARESMPDTNIGHEDLQAVLEASHRAKNLIRQLLTFSRRENSEPESVDLAALISSGQKMLRRLITEAIDVEYEVEEGSLLVWGDPALIQQVLINLAVNSRDAMGDSGTLRITLQRTEVTEARDCRVGHVGVGSYALLTVSDTGCGMDEDAQRRVFEPFYTTKPAGKGTGLGMAMVRGTIESVDGGLEMQSMPGVGTSIQMLLPLSDEETLAALEAEADPELPTGLALLVEDDAAIRRLVTRALEGRGWQVVSAGDGVEGLARFDALARPCDLLITDAIMPRMGGAELARRLRQRVPDLPILVMSGYLGQEVAAADLIEAGYGVLSKPFAMAELFSAIGSVLPADARLAARLTGRHRRKQR